MECFKIQTFNNNKLNPPNKEGLKGSSPRPEAAKTYYKLRSIIHETLFIKHTTKEKTGHMM